MPDGLGGPTSAATWRHARGTIDLARPRVMGIVNVTPDSFADGGRFLADAAAKPSVAVVVAACARWVDAGVDVLDVGGESTRPGATPVDPDDELRRVLPVIRALRAEPAFDRVAISVDTRRASVARAGVEAGADIINDVSGLADAAMIDVAADLGAGLVIGHLRGEPSTMQSQIAFADLLGEVADELGEACARARAGGVDDESIVVDPGVGFGKTAAQSAALVGSAGRVRAATGRPVLIGASRKRFLGSITGHPVEARGPASVAAALIAVTRGASIVRVHDVPETIEALSVLRAVDEALREEGVDR